MLQILTVGTKRMNLEWPWVWTQLSLNLSVTIRFQAIDLCHFLGVDTLQAAWTASMQ